MQGLKHLVSGSSHRKEFVAGNLAEYCTSGQCFQSFPLFESRTIYRRIL